MARSVFLTRVGYALVLILGIRLCYLLVQYVVSSAGVQRFHIESTAFILVVIGVCFRLWRHLPRRAASPRATPHSPFELLALIALAFGLY